MNNDVNEVLNSQDVFTTAKHEELMKELENPFVSQVPENAVEIKRLPSKFKPYPNCRVFYTPIKFKELEVLNKDDDAEEKLELALAYLLNAIYLVDKSGNRIPSEELSYVDFVYIGLARMLKSLKSVKGTMTAECPQCKLPVSQEVDFDTIEFEPISDDVTLPISINIGGQDLEFKPLTVKAFLELYEEEDASMTSTFAHLCSNKSYEEVLPLIEEATEEDIIKLLEADADMSFDLKPIKMTCKCGAEVEKEFSNPFCVDIAFDLNTRFKRNR